MNKHCPFCHTEIEISLVRHIKAEHGEEMLRKAILADKRNGVPDAQIGDKYGISFSYLERVITQEYGGGTTAVEAKLLGRRCCSANTVDDDLSMLSVTEFATEMQKATHESYRVLKPGRQCEILIGGSRKAEYINFAYEPPNCR